MQHPLLALTWQSWRLSRRWFSWVLPTVIAMAFAIVSAVNTTFSKYPNAGISIPQLIMARGIFITTFSLAALTTLISMSLGARKGFPYSFEFRLPINTIALVCVPILVQVFLCSAIYAVPVLIARVLYNVVIPVMPAVALLSLLAVSMLAGSWSLRAMRGAGVVPALIAYIQFFAWLSPLHMNEQRTPATSSVPDMIALSATDYLIITGTFVLLLSLLVKSVRLQRCDEPWKLWPRDSGNSATARNAVSLLTTLHERIITRLAIPCPRSTPWQAEVWYEAQRYGLPMIIYCALLALALPALFFVAHAFNWPGLRFTAALTPLWMYFGGIGIIINRRELQGGYLSSFEATRRLTTIQLASVQLLVLAISTLLGGLVLLLGVKVSALLTGEVVDLGSWMRFISDSMASASLMQALAELACIAIFHLTVVALFSCLQASAQFWGKKFFLGIVAIVFYSIYAAGQILTSQFELNAIQNHMWGVAWCVLFVTLLALGNLLRRKLASRRAWVIALSYWGVFLLCGFTTLDHVNINFAALPSELIALNLAVLTLPFTSFLLTLWSYDRLRHR